MAYQGLHKAVISILFQNLGLSSLFLICVVLWVFGGWAPLTASYAAGIYAVSAFFIGLLGFILWFKQEGVHYKLGTFSDKRMWSASSNLWAASCMTLLVQWSGVLVAGILITSQELAFLSAAQRAAMLTNFVLIVVNMVVAPRYAKLWQQNKRAEIKKLAKLSTRAMIAMVLPVILIFVVVPEWIMSFFGEGFERGSSLLLIMALGQFVNVATGSVGYLLTMSGHERDFRRVTLFAGPLTVILSYLLIMEYGALGAAIATAIGLSVQNIGALIMVRKRLGFWPVG
jgi:O-antigen/teichoic acid export membrane protein